VAYHYPYTFSDLQRYLDALQHDPLVGGYFRRQTLCHTLGGRRCDLLTITSLDGDPDTIRRRRCVMLTSRVHPGESNASWIMKGVIDFLVGPSLDARLLRSALCFKIVPMLNPDGVAAGNYRCNLAGVDLNRQWANPHRYRDPTVFWSKELIKRLVAERGSAPSSSPTRAVLLYCDFHGHSRRKNVFMYGCCPWANRDAKSNTQDYDSDGGGEDPLLKKSLDKGTSTSSSKTSTSSKAKKKPSTKSRKKTMSPSPSLNGLMMNVPGTPNDAPSTPPHESTGAPGSSSNGSAARNELYLQRFFPRMMRDRAPHLFAHDLCCFKVQKSKACTARVTLWRELGLKTSYTLEASFCGSDRDITNGMTLSPGRQLPDQSLQHPRSQTPSRTLSSSLDQSLPRPSTVPPTDPSAPFKLTHFDTRDLTEVGRYFCECLLELFDPPSGRLEGLVREIDQEWGLAPITTSSSSSFSAVRPPSAGDSDASDASRVKRQKSPISRRRKPSTALAPSPSSSRAPPATTSTTTTTTTTVAKSIKSVAPIPPVAPSRILPPMAERPKNVLPAIVQATSAPGTPPRTKTRKPPGTPG